MGLLDQTFGALYIAGSIGMVMYGITILQTYFYFVVYYVNDPIKLKILVTSAWLLDTLHSALVAHFNYYYLVSSFGNPMNLQDGVGSFFASDVVVFLINLLVKCFYVTQIYQLSTPPWKLWLSSFLVILLLFHFALGIGTAVLFFSKVKFVLLAHTVKWRVIALSATNLMLDATITVALCGLLRNRRSDWAGSKVNVIIRNLVVFCVERFMLSSIVSLLQLVMYLVLPDAFYASALEIILAKLYINSLLATLNSRQSMRGVGINVRQSSTETSTGSYPLESTHLRRNVITSLQSGRHADAGSIEDVGRFGLHTSDLEGSVKSDKI